MPDSSERLERFKSLLRRSRESSQLNIKDVIAERARIPDERVAQRQKIVAELALEKLNVKEAGENFERKRGWNWTIEESEQWQKRSQRKKKNRERNKCSDYEDIARLNYEQQINKISNDRQEGIELLVSDLQERDKLKLKRKLRRNPEETDVNYINNRNRQFNLKLSRYYDKYTAQIRENLERGSAT